MNYLYILAGTGAVGAISGGIYLAYPHSPTFRSKSIEDKLRQEYFVPITEDGAGQTMLTKYNEKKNEARFTSEKVDVKLEDLKSACKKALSENADTSENYEKSRRGCTIPKTLSSLLEAHKLNLLNTSDGSENQQEGDKLQKSYEKASENRIDGLDLGSGGDKGKKLREKCKEISQKDSTEENFETLFSNLKRGCTKEESDKLTQ